MENTEVVSKDPVEEFHPPVQVGQKLYHYAFGEMVVTAVYREEFGAYIETEALDLKGYRGEGHVNNTLD